MWKTLRPIKSGQAKEKKLQGVFDHWPAPGWRIAGGPPWLFEKFDLLPRQKFAAFGCRNEPDVYWRQGAMERVIELKLAVKYEPLALAQVLYYKHLLLELNPARVTAAPRTIRPTVISSYSPWLRAARHVLASEQKGDLGLDCLEVDVLGGRILWFDAPAASWIESRPPRAVLAGAAYREANWYLVESSGTWFGVRHPEPQRPVLMTQPYVMLAPLRTADGANTGEYVFWQGAPPRRCDPRGSRAWPQSMYRLFCRGKGELDLAPPWSGSDHPGSVALGQCPTCSGN